MTETGADRLYRHIKEGPQRFRVLEEPDETLHNTPEDVRYYVEWYDGDDFFVLTQGSDRIVIGRDEWERFCTDVMGVLMQQEMSNA